MKIDCELTDEETSVLSFMLGYGAGSAALAGPQQLAMAIDIINRIMHNNPEFLPYRMEGGRAIRTNKQ